MSKQSQNFRKPNTTKQTAKKKAFADAIEQLGEPTAAPKEEKPTATPTKPEKATKKAAAPAVNKEEKSAPAQTEPEKTAAAIPAKEETTTPAPSPLDNWKEAEKVEDYTILTPETRRKLNNKNATIVIKVQERFKELAIARQKDLGLKNLTTYITYAIAKDLGIKIE